MELIWKELDAERLVERQTVQVRVEGDLPTADGRTPKKVLNLNSRVIIDQAAVSAAVLSAVPAAVSAVVLSAALAVVPAAVSAVVPVQAVVSEQAAVSAVVPVQAAVLDRVLYRPRGRESNRV